MKSIFFSCFQNKHVAFLIISSVLGLLKFKKISNNEFRFISIKELEYYDEIKYIHNIKKQILNWVAVFSFDFLKFACSIK